MDSPERIFCQTHYRHLRLLFLIDSAASIQYLADLFYDNYQLWGGRYNPIIPIYNGEISAFYLNQLEAYDPDIVFYSAEVGREQAFQICKKLYPREFIQLDPNGRNNFPGVYSHNLIPEGSRQANRLLRNFTLVYFNHHNDEPQTSFYNLSFGLGNRYHDDLQLARGHVVVELDVTNISETNRRLAELRPFYACLLSELQTEITLLRPTNEWEFHCFELVIYDANNGFDDLIYFWNRQQHQRPEARIRQIIASKEQMRLLMEDVNFGALLLSLRGDSDVYLHSLSLTNEELLTFQTFLRGAFANVPFRLISNRTFPRTMGNENLPHSREVKKEKSMLLGKKDHLRLPPPVWNQESPPIKGTYIYDVEFFEEGDYSSNWIKLPYGTVTDFLIVNHSSRVNKAHHISIVMRSENSGLDIRSPSGAEIFLNRLRVRVENGELIHIPVEYVQHSDAGLKLSAFVGLFDKSLIAASEIINERWWIDLILGQSRGINKKRFSFSRIKNTDDGPVDVVFEEITAKSNIHNYGGVFSYEDLQAERRLVYLEHHAEIKAWLAANEMQINDDEFVSFIKTSIAEDFAMHIDNDLQYLVERDALFIGMKVKCNYCGSNTWYPLSELKNKMHCKGCLQIVIPTVKSSLYYRFNDVVYNNISSDAVKRLKTFHGNYIVLRTLSAFSMNHRSLQSFHWTPSMDVGIRTRKGVLSTDIDVLMLQNGELILGEAKADAKQFTVDQLDKLKLMAETFKPDKAIIAYKDGQLPVDRIVVLTEELNAINCQLITHQVSDPDYFFGRLG